MSISITQTTRPNRVTTANKDKDYHLEFGRWASSASFHHLHHHFISKTLINWNFYKGNQWVFNEDLESFLKDESGDVRNRIKFVKNLIRPMVEQYVGNAVRLNYNARAFSISELAINRREQELARLKFMGNVAQEVPELAPIIRDQFPVGETEEETEEIFENIFIDDHVTNINFLLKYIEEENDIEQLTVRLAKQLAISGLGIIKGFEQNGEYVLEIVNSLFFFFDRGAKRPDLLDAEYMGEINSMMPTDLMERFQNMTTEERKAVEEFTRIKNHNQTHLLLSNHFGFDKGRVPVFETYWRDIDQEEWGYVLDEFGYEMFTRINDESSEFTTKDLIQPESEAHMKILKGKKSKKIFKDRIRYCIFIPKEEFGGNNNKDIVLEFGVMPHRESLTLSPSVERFPYKCNTWAYDNGEVLSPIDDAIKPQRFINRMISVAESQINNSRGSGTVIDKNAVDPQDGEEGVIRAINANKPIFLDASRTGSIQNSIGSYDSTIGSGTIQLFNLVSEVQTAIQDITGVNEAMQGNQGGNRELVGVLESRISRGSLIQEPFYFALTNILKQVYEGMATVGKKIYAQNPRRLAIIAGDKGAREIEITKEFLLEDFRIAIKRTVSDETKVEAGNNLLLTLLPTGLLDPKNTANLFNRAGVEEIADALRKHQNVLAEAQRMRDAAQEEALQQAQQQQQQAIQTAEAKEDEDKISQEIESEKDRQHDIDSITARTQGQIARDEARGV